jgi:phospholipase C
VESSFAVTRARRTVPRVLALLALVALSACAGASAPANLPTMYVPVGRLTAVRPAMPVFPPVDATRLRALSQKIEHVVIIMQENRSFNYMFLNYPGATTQASGLNSHGQTIPLQPITLAAPYDIEHETRDFFSACDGSPPGQNCKFDGWDLEYLGGTYGPNPEYGYAPPSDVQTYWNMANQYVLADMMFTSNIDASFASHQYIIAGQADHEANLPSASWGCGGGSGDQVQTLQQNAQRGFGPNQSPCRDYKTLGDELTKNRKEWRYYSAPTSDIGYIWSAYQAVKHDYYGKIWQNHVFTPSGQVLTDVASGKLGAVTWVLPSWQNSDHPGSRSTTGPQWVASVVNAIGQSKFWKSTVIFVFWDEWGGWFDAVQPPYVDYDGLGFRVPLIMISPYAKQGSVTHVQYEHGSMLRFIEDDFGLAQLAASDARANDPANDPAAFDFTQAPRPYSPFATKLPPSYFINERPSQRVPHVVVPPGAN